MDRLDFLRTNIASKELPTYVYGYPSKRAFRAFPQPLRITDVVEQANRSKQINIYIHIPFCRYRCTYCTLFLTTRRRRETRASYVNRLIEHIARYGEYFGDREVVSIYFGGGTPTLLTQHQFGELFAALDVAFPKRSSRCETTVESTPDSFDNNLLDSLKALGVDRMSIGIQSMEPGELAHSGRPYSLQTAKAAIKALGQYHYSTDYAVASRAASPIINAFSARPFDPDAIASHGIRLTQEDLRRRYVLLGLTLSALSRSNYAAVFRRALAADFGDELKALESLQLVNLADGDAYQLTRTGFKYSSIIARMFYSGRMAALEEEYQAA